MGEPTAPPADEIQAACKEPDAATNVSTHLFMSVTLLPTKNLLQHWYYHYRLI